MNSNQDPWHNRKSPIQKVTHLQRPMDHLGEKPTVRTEHTRMSLGRRAAGVLLAGATLLPVGNWFMDRAVESIELETVKPTPAQAERVKVAMANQPKPLEAKNDTSEAQLSTPPTSIHTVQAGESSWSIARDAANQGFIDGEIRPTVDDLQAQADADGDGLQPGEKLTVRSDN